MYPPSSSSPTTSSVESSSGVSSVTVSSSPEAVQEVAPLLLVLPLAQLVHEIDASTELYVPAAQFTQADDEVEPVDGL
jgi:hypothetical protein